MITLTPYLDTRNKKATEFPLMIRLTANRTSSYIPTNIKLRAEQWQNEQIVCHRQAKALNRILTEKLAKLRLQLAEVSNTTALNGLKAADVRKLLLNEKQPKNEVAFVDYAQKFICTKKAPKTQETYNYTLKAIERFMGSRKLLLTDISLAFIREFESWLQTSCKTNTISIHLRNIRAIINSAIDDELLPQEAYPFRRYRIKSAPTMKRSLSLEQVRRLIEYPCNNTQAKYRDVFLLSLYLAGINMVDLLHIKALSADGKLTYIRAKTGIPCVLSVPQEAMSIIEKYKGENHLLVFMDRYKEHKNFVHHLNSALSSFDGFRGVTSYWARHTWATLAAEIDIPEATIDMALGHKSPYPMSDIYIARNRSKVDDAIMAVIDFIKNGSTSQSSRRKQF